MYLPISWIYHNIRCVHRLRGSQGVSDGKPVKQATNHPKTRQKRAERFSALCMTMHRTDSRAILA
ncbi:hypothetical protein A4K53_22695 [Salmonella enterica subsp. enterica serovar Amager]|nr:hypothetical protein [Salmonella enterica subsp. enterica serovar Amager]ECD6440434.1 hypothetical protein [Salmonella enterica subsp. enterica serovar Amager]ECZ9786083.1 hypothetical protein [Salmonella enterica subsp. enterica serovar Amager]EDA8494248.1 hypothetical protein [Salmonella enterica subsp. enterica serovar Amager]